MYEIRIQSAQIFFLCRNFCFFYNLNSVHFFLYIANLKFVFVQKKIRLPEKYTECIWIRIIYEF